jgi:hypothetical protein
MAEATQSVSQSTYRLDQARLNIAIGLRVDLAAQVIDVDIDDIRPRLGGHLPDLGEQLTAGDALATMHQEIFEQRKFLRGKANGPAGAGDLVLDAMQFKIAMAKHRIGELLTPSQQCPATRRQFEETEWLEQAIIGSQIQALHSRLKIVAAGKYQHRSVIVARLHLGQYLHAISFRKAEVQEHEIRVNFCGTNQRGLSVLYPLDPVALHFHSSF